MVRGDCGAIHVRLFASDRLHSHCDFFCAFPAIDVDQWNINEIVINEERKISEAEKRGDGKIHIYFEN
jgi:hypothetical protein